MVRFASRKVKILSSLFDPYCSPLIITETTMSFPYLHTDTSTLGNHTSTFFKVSADSQDSWINNIFHNSRYGIFCLADGKLELISKGLNTTKFRKCKCNDQETALTKIQQWIEKF